MADCIQAVKSQKMAYYGLSDQLDDVHALNRKASHSATVLIFDPEEESEHVNK